MGLRTSTSRLGRGGGLLENIGDPLAGVTFHLRLQTHLPGSSVPVGLYKDTACTIPATADGDSVAAWRDELSASGVIAVQATSASRPKLKIVRGVPVLRFDGTDDWLNIPNQALGDFGAFVTCSHSGDGCLLGDNTGNWQIRIGQSGGNTISTNDPSSHNSISSTLGTSGSSLVEYLRASGTVSFYQNGLPYGTGAMVGTTSLLFFGTVVSGIIPLNGDVTSCFLVNAPTVGQRQTVESYLLPFVPRLVVFDGNSFVEGFHASSGDAIDPPTGTTFPAVALGLLGTNWEARQFGIGGQTTPEMAANAAAKIDVLYRPGRKNVLVACEITNDLYWGASHSSPASAATAYSNYVAYCQARRAVGWKVVAMPVLPRSSPATPGTFEASRTTVNGLLRANWATFADALADVAADARIGAAGAQLDPTYYYQGGPGEDVATHPIDAGYAIMGQIVANSIGTIP